MSEETWEPQVGEYCRIKGGIGCRAKFGKILAPSSEEPEELFLVACIDEESSYPYGFVIRFKVMCGEELLPITDSDKLIANASNKSTQRVREEIKQFYRDRAIALFSKKLGEALEDI